MMYFCGRCREEFELSAMTLQNDLYVCQKCKVKDTATQDSKGPPASLGGV